MFEDQIICKFNLVETLFEAGINEFVFDFSALDAKFISLLLDEFFHYIQNVK